MKNISGFLLLSFLIAGCAGHDQALLPTHTQGSAAHASGPVGMLGSSIKHVVVIELENRSFDSYFGTYPGVNGIPKHPNCNPDPQDGKCYLPFHNRVMINYGGPHGPDAMATDIDGGLLDGFIRSAEQQPHNIDPQPHDVMGYHTCRELPQWCAYAAQYTIADNHFAATNSWSVMAHLYLVSGWSAKCTSSDPMSCVSSNDAVPGVDDYAWTDITWLLHSHGISWGYFIYGSPHQLGPRYDGGDDEMPGPDGFTVATQWNPLPGFEDVRADGQLQNVQDGDRYLSKAAAGTLPTVSWVIPPFLKSDHPSNSVALAQTWTKKQVDAALNGPDGSSTLILVTWDEWGGFYDHVIPPVIDAGGYGFRTPLILIGPMVKSGFIDHQLLTSDSYLKLIEDLFLGSARIDSNDGRPDSRPDVREKVPGLGDIRNDLRR
jgi:phospholipase C